MSVKEIKKIQRANPHAKIVLGKVSRKKVSSLATYTKMQNDTNVLMKSFEDGNGNFTAPSPDNRAPENSLYIHPDYKFIGSGMQRNAYLHKPTGIVYKVPNSNLYHNPPKGAEDAETMFLIEQHSYAELYGAGLNKKNIEYAETCFIKSRGVGIQVQKYLDPQEYKTVSFDESLEIEHNLMRFENLEDIHPGNLRRNVRTGKIVLFDCLALTDSSGRTISRFDD